MYCKNERAIIDLELPQKDCHVALVLVSPTLAVMVGWLVAMILRQIGHFYFEPKNYDNVNAASHEYKESIKVGYNLKIKVILLSIWIASPFLLLVDSSLFGLLTTPSNLLGVTDNISIIWFAVGVGALVFRTVHLFFIMNVKAGFVWFTKILTDPFHDVYIYAKAPGLLLKGDKYDDMSDWYIKDFVK